jgi:hypothetical protein
MLQNGYVVCKFYQVLHSPVNIKQVHAVVGVLSDDTDPMVTVMKLEKAPQETYADIGGRCSCLWVWFCEIYFPLIFLSVHACR